MDVDPALLIGGGGTLLGIVLGVVAGRLSKRTPPVMHAGMTTSGAYDLVGGRVGEHEHVYTWTRGDGKGWRCGVCGRPKPK